MWHEARKQERMIRGLIVDYRRRAERRKDFYEKIKAEPTQFLQLHGRPCKIHLDPAVAAAGDSPAIMMPWQGDNNNMIDRFDVRAHLDYIPEVKIPDVAPEDLEQEERQCNYERYRILAQNSFLSISEDKFLQQLAIEEQFGVTIDEKEAQKEKLHEKKGTGVAIGYNYNDPAAQQPSSSIGPETKQKVDKQESDDDSDLEIIDVDLSIDVNKMEASQAHELNAVGPQYGMSGCDLFSFLTGDADDAEHQKQLLREEKEKAMYSGRKSRRERRAHRDKKLSSRVLSPPSYAAPPAAPAPPRSPSRSPSPAPQDRIQFITSFGGDDDDVSKTLYSEKLKQNLKKTPLYSEVARKPKMSSRSTSRDRTAYRPRMGPHRPKSRSKSISRSYSRSRSRSVHKKRSRSYSRSRSRSQRSRSRSKSYSPQYRRSRSKSRNRNYRGRRSRSPENISSGYGKRFDSRPMSSDSNDKGHQAKPLPRYYGRKKDEDKSSSELSLDSDTSEDEDSTNNKSAVGNKSNSNQNQLRLTGSSSKVLSTETTSLKDKLKKKMQAQLSRQLRLDKRLEADRLAREARRQERRDEEMRDLAIKMRRRQREMRHQQNRKSSDDSDRSRSGSSSRDSQPREKKAKEDASRSKSPSPAPAQEKRVQVWDSQDGGTQDGGAQDGGHYREGPQDYYNRRRQYEHSEHYYDREDRGQYEDRTQYNRYRQYEDRPPPPPREYDNRHDYQNYDNRYQREGNYNPGERRPFRGGFRGHNRRYGEQGGGPSNWQQRDVRENEGRQGSSYNKNKVKLVDY